MSRTRLLDPVQEARNRLSNLEINYHSLSHSTMMTPTERFRQWEKVVEAFKEAMRLDPGDRHYPRRYEEFLRNRPPAPPTPQTAPGVQLQAPIPQTVAAASRARDAIDVATRAPFPHLRERSIDHEAALNAATQRLQAALSEISPQGASGAQLEDLRHAIHHARSVGVPQAVIDRYQITPAIAAPTRARTPTRVQFRPANAPEETLPRIRPVSRGRTPTRARTVDRNLAEIAPINEIARGRPLTDLEDFAANQTPAQVRELFAINPIEAIARFPTETQNLRFVPEEHRRNEAPTPTPQTAPAPRRVYEEKNLTNEVLNAGTPADSDARRIEGTAAFLGGQSGMLKQFLHMQMLNSNIPYQPSPHPRIAELSRPQMEAYKMIHDLSTDASGAQEQAYKDIDRTIGQAEQPFYDKKVQPFLYQGTSNITPSESRALSPYDEDYLARIAERRRHTFEHDVLPRIQAQLTGRGVRNLPGAKSHFIQKALEANERQIAEQLDDLRHKGHAMGLTEAGHGRERQLTAAHHATFGQLGERSQSMEAAKLYQEALKQHNAQNRANASQLAEQGAIHQVEAQRKLDEANAEHNRPILHDIEQQQRLGEALRGLPRTTSTIYSLAKPEREPFTSPYTAAGSLLGSLTGLANEKRAKGGRIKKAIGGSLQIPQEIDYINAMNNRVGQLESGQHSPFWTGYTNLMTNIGASKRKSLPGAISESLPAMASGWRHASEQNEHDTDRALAIRHAYVQSLQIQEARQQKLQLARETLETQKQHYGGLDRLHALQAQKAERDLQTQGLERPPLRPADINAKNKYLANLSSAAMTARTQDPLFEEIRKSQGQLESEGSHFAPGSFINRNLNPEGALYKGLLSYASPEERENLAVFKKSTRQLTNLQQKSNPLQAIEALRSIEKQNPVLEYPTSANEINLHAQKRLSGIDIISHAIASKVERELQGRATLPEMTDAVNLFWDTHKLPQSPSDIKRYKGEIDDFVKEFLNSHTLNTSGGLYHNQASDNQDREITDEEMGL